MIERGRTVPSSMPESLGERTGGDVPHDDFQRYDLDFLDQLLAHVQPADEMRRDAHPVQMREDVLRNAIVEHALAVDDIMLLLVEGSGIVLEELDERTWLRAFVKDLGLALVNPAATVHDRLLCHGRLDRAESAFRSVVASFPRAYPNWSPCTIGGPGRSLVFRQVPGDFQFGSRRAIFPHSDNRRGTERDDYP